ncbi:hypothetical protein P3L10_020338 [Capsicum annuum]
MDKSWIEKPRNTSGYKHDLNQFLNFAFMNAAVGDNIKYPYRFFHFKKWQIRDIVYDHLIWRKA